MGRPPRAHPQTPPPVVVPHPPIRPPRTAEYVRAMEEATAEYQRQQAAASASSRRAKLAKPVQSAGIPAHAHPTHATHGPGHPVRQPPKHGATRTKRGTR